MRGIRVAHSVSRIRTHGLKQSIKQSRRPEIYKYTRLLVSRWVKLSLNFELLVNRVLKFLLGQRLFNNNIFVQFELFRIQETTKKIK